MTMRKKSAAPAAKSKSNTPGSPEGEQEKVKTVVLEKVKQDEIRAKLPFLKDGDDFTLSK